MTSADAYFFRPLSKKKKGAKTNMMFIRTIQELLRGEDQIQQPLGGCVSTDLESHQRHSH